MRLEDEELTYITCVEGFIFSSSNAWSERAAGSPSTEREKEGGSSTEAYPEDKEASHVTPFRRMTIDDERRRRDRGPACWEGEDDGGRGGGVEKVGHMEE